MGGQLLADRADDAGEPVRPGCGRIERQHHQSELAVGRQQLAANDLIRHHPLHQPLVVGALRQRVREQRRWNLVALGRLTRGKYGDQAARSFEQLKLDREFAQVLQGRSLEQPIAFDNDQHVELVGGKAAGDLRVCFVFRGIGPEQLAERVVDLHARKADRRQRAKHDESERAQHPVRWRKEADPLNPQGQIARRDGARRLDGVVVRRRMACHKGSIPNIGETLTV